MHSRLPWLMAVFLLGLTTARAEEPFSKAIRPEDFTAAELDKLSPAALARLDELVQAYKSGAVATARAEAVATTQAAAARAAAETPPPAPKPASPGFLAKAKVLLTPGTEVEYADVESHLVGTFTGWQSSTVFTLENGQRWRLANGGFYDTPPVERPAVKITPARLGGFWMTIEGVNQRVKVVPLTSSR